MADLLIDTCLAIWLSEKAYIAPRASAAMAVAAQAGDVVYVSPITAWEIGMLVARRRLRLTTSPERWLQDLLTAPGLHLAPLPPRILIAAHFLPGTPPNDPADRIIAATARDLDATLLTRDRLLLNYGQLGHVRVQAC